MSLNKLAMLVSAVSLVGGPVLAAETAMAPAAKDQAPVQVQGNQFADNPTLLIVCTKQAYPGGMTCTQPSSLGSTWTGDVLNNAFIQYGCSRAGGTAYTYSCTGKGLEGAVQYWIFTDTGNVSTILYVPYAV
ncbi:hypothetical protein [Parachitinimonas caeni]|uniref:Ig-like domain-containing protein n=1 Tax=Parachitinimonas caeni TaxID=3031301 RepID=A0ABT7DV34_9NEIS|nr:hypothetical protein [Parachitinimonas caeni]MDK2122995.1 hypothetical protein [Parachitinimonas caeni]